MKPIDPRILAKLEQTDPDLVAQYRAKMSGTDQAMTDARQMQDMGNYANVAGQALNDFSNSQKQDVILKNRMDSLGKAPGIHKADRPAYDDSLVNNMTAQGVNRAKEDRARAEDSFFKEDKLGWASKERGRQEDVWARQDDITKREDDPSSEESQMAQMLATKFMPGRDFSGQSATQLKSSMPTLGKIYEIEQRKVARTAAPKAPPGYRYMSNGSLEAIPGGPAAGKATTAGQRKVDEDYAKHYNDFTSKGHVNARQTIDQLKDLQAELLAEKDDLIQSGGGRLTPLIPDMLRTKKSLSWKTEIPAKANLVLKDLFGGQLSDAERKAESETYYNDMLPPEENAALLQKKIETMEKQLQSETDKALFYQDRGSLEGYRYGGNSQAPSPTQPPSKPKHGSELP